MSNHAAEGRINMVVMNLIAATSDEARGMRAAKTPEELTQCAMTISRYVAIAQVEILAICKDLADDAIPSF